MQKENDFNQSLILSNSLSYCYGLMITNKIPNCRHPLSKINGPYEQEIL